MYNVYMFTKGMGDRVFVLTLAFLHGGSLEITLTVPLRDSP